MTYSSTGPFLFDCTKCTTRCDGISKGVYNFNNDSQFSEHYEQMIIDRINRSKKYAANKCEEPGYPDIEVKNTEGKLHQYIEVKVQQRTFMQVQKYLPQSALLPSETVALNESDLLRYFEMVAQKSIPTVIVWVLLNRLCIVPAQTHHLYYQHIQALQKIHSRFLHTRRFKRKSGEGDIVDGVHKGVTVNYHFSLNELKRWM